MNNSMAPARRLDVSFPFFDCDFGSILPPGRTDEIVRCASLFAEYSRLNGGSMTSRQRQLGYSADDPVGAVTGTVVSLELPWLDEFYRGEVADLVNGLDLGDFRPSDDQRSSININMLPPGSGYEWHVDTNPMTALLFVTDHPEGAGGELVFRPDPVTRPQEEWELRIHPRRGRLLIFDAREAAHNVRPVIDGQHRISVPMNFYYVNESSNRPEGLDRYLYGR